MSKPKNVAQVLLDILADAGARDIFGVTGDALNPVLEAIRTDGRFHWYGVRHEENAAYAAYAQAELTGGIGVCAGTVGPGALHLINGLYNAKREGAGVVAITGQVAHHEKGTGYFQEVDLTKAFDDICDYQAIVNTPEQIARVAEIAVQKALVERCVVRIELPVDVIGAASAGRHFLHPLLHAAPAMAPEPHQLRAAADVIGHGKKVTLFCGIGCRSARDEVLALAEKLGAPIVHTLRAKDIFDYGDPNVVGLTGLIGNPAGYHAIWDCDVLVMLGTNFPYDGFIPDGIEIVQVDRRVENIGRRAPVTAGIIGDVKETVAALTPLVKAHKDHSLLHHKEAHFLEHLGTVRDRWLEAMDEQADLGRTDTPLHPQLFAKAINDRASDDAFFGVDVGECTVWAARHLRLPGARRMAGSFNHGSLGAGFPVAMGAAALDPSRQVWALVGDGGFGMAMQDFVTAVRFGWPVKVIVFDNSELGFVKMETEVSGLPLYPEATGLVNPDFAAYARACGAEGVRVTEAADIVPAIEAAIAYDGPFIIDAIVSPGELTMPPHLSSEEAWGFGVSKAREGLIAIRGEHEQWDGWVDELKANLHTFSLKSL
jgi:thiamine pyrophosphate-dependent acetolactate synthase large subunit-like protein